MYGNLATSPLFNQLKIFNFNLFFFSLHPSCEGGYVVSERYYNNKGEAYLEIHYTCHGNPKTHPVVPHIHRWSKDENGVLKPGKWEDFQ